MTALSDARFARICKLSVVATAIGFCLAGALFFLNGTPRSIASGALVGLALSVPAWLIDGYWRRGPVVVDRAVVEKRARRNRAGVVIGIILGSLLVLPIRVFHAEWFSLGFMIGFFAPVVLMVTPLFWDGPTRRAEPSPRSRMTSMERGTHTPYK